MTVKKQRASVFASARFFSFPQDQVSSVGIMPSKRRYFFCGCFLVSMCLQPHGFRYSTTNCKGWARCFVVVPTILCVYNHMVFDIQPQITKAEPAVLWLFPRFYVFTTIQISIFNHKLQRPAGHLNTVFEMHPHTLLVSSCFYVAILSAVRYNSSNIVTRGGPICLQLNAMEGNMCSMTTG